MNSQDRRDLIICNLQQHLQNKRIDYARGEETNNVPLQGASIGAASEEIKKRTGILPRKKDKALVWFISDMKAEGPWDQYFLKKFAKTKLTKERDNINNAFWTNDVAPTTGREHVHMLLYLFKPRNKFQVCALLGMQLSEKNCLPVTSWKSEYNRTKYIEDKANVTYWFRPEYRHMLPKLPNDRKMRDPTVPEVRRSKYSVSSASEEVTPLVSEGGVVWDVYDPDQDRVEGLLE